VKPDFPFSAVVGQEELKLALLMVAIDSTIGGVLITGERGTAKSTVARGLAALLPVTPAGHAAPFVQLPLGASEDRVVGSLDLTKVLQDGSTQLRPGVLARADGGVLYVDEVNLLPDHLVDLLLDAAASGRVSMERDGISARQPARFVLVGTMNPEEGALRPQFLDRFGLCVQVRGITTREPRKAAIRQRLSFDDNPHTVLESAGPQDQGLRERIAAARARLTAIPIEESHLEAVAALAIEQGLDGIRGDLAILKTARALAVWENAAAIDEEHLWRAAQLALPHRAARTSRPPGKRYPAPGLDDPQPPAKESPPQVQPAPPELNTGPIRLLTDLVDRTTSGRRLTQTSGAQSGSVATAHRATPVVAGGPLAMTETLAAAAGRGARVQTRGVQLSPSDLRHHEGRDPARCHVLFLVDASGSMATQRRLSVAKGAALGLLAGSQQRRDEVALMTFRGEGSELVLPFTGQVPSVEDALTDVHTGGRTPLARALLDAHGLLQTREPALLVLFTDGRTNVSATGGDPWQETLAACGELRATCAGALVIDCEPGPIMLGRARQIAQALGGQHVTLDDLDSGTLTVRIRRQLEML
jgi:magnesium chelatase subunit D